MNQVSEWRLNDAEFRERLITAPKDIRFYSQQDEDKYMLLYLLKGDAPVSGGVYVELGNGVTSGKL